MRPSALIAIAAALSLAPATLAQAQPGTKGEPKSVDAVRPTSTGAVPQATLDDFISGFNGDKDAMGRAMKATDDILAKDPNNVEALAWNSSGKAAQCGDAFQSGDFRKGMQLWSEGKSGLNKAVSLAPDNVSVRIVRGKTMLESSLHDPMPASSKEAAETAVGDLETALELFGKNLDAVDAAFKQEMYAWLYQAASKAGDAEKAEKYKKLAGDKATDAMARLNQSAENTVIESAKAALVILDSPLVQEIKPDLLAGLRSPAKLDAVISVLDKKIDSKPDDAAAIAWRGFTRVLRTGSIFAQSKIEDAGRAWEKGLNEINAAASTDATNRDAILLRAVTNLEKARRESDADQRATARQKSLTDLDRFARLLKDNNITLSPEAQAALHVTSARVHLMNGDTKRARAELTAATKADASDLTARRAKTMTEIAEMIEARK
ncbi:MAG TPA: hypothetical protein VD997_04510 [Phycisphaerales bacterium]|nr:hypothetical protein [Phycisphaerales bacterium]